MPADYEIEHLHGPCEAQTLKKISFTDATTFVDPGSTAAGPKDIVTAEYRGSYQIERYVDPNLPTTGGDAIPDYADNLNGTLLSTFYKFHTIGTRKF